MSNFENIGQNLGVLKVGQKTPVIFKLKEGVTNPGIVHVTASCGCTKAKFDEKLRAVTATYTPKSIPHQRRSEGFYTPTNRITVTYKDGAKETLNFTAKIIN